MTPGALALPAARRRHPWVIASLLSLTILVCGWSALWLVARHEAEAVMDRWMEAEAAHGRDWSCPDRVVTGFPLGLHIACTHPTFSGRVGGVPVTATLGKLDAEAAIYQPNAIDGWVGGPFTVHREGHPDVSANWGAFLVEARILSKDSARAAFLVDDLSAVDEDGRTSRARHAELRLAPTGSRPAADRAYDVWFDLFDGAVPALDQLLGTSDLLSVEQRGVVSQVQDTAFAPWPQLLEQWRQSGGAFDLETLKVTKGDLKAEARGLLGLDEDHRLTGRFETAVSGYESVASRLGLPLQAVSMGGALASLFGSKANPAPAMIGAIPLPLVLARGRLSIGPFKTAVRLDPLY